LGILGALIFPGRMEFVSNPFANLGGATVLAWMTAAFAAVWLLHRLENVQVTRHIYVLMALAWALSLMFPLGFVDEKFKAPACCAWLCIMGLLLLVAGASVSRLRNQGESNLSWVECLMRGPAVALAAPLLLFASRPVARRGSSSPMQTLSRVAFAVFPYALAAGFTLTLFGSECYRHALWLRLLCLSFSVWAWLGCALLFLLSPWPEYPHILRRGSLRKAHKVSSLFAAALMGIGLAALVLKGHPVFLIFLHPIFIWPALGCALLFLLSLWRVYPGFSRMNGLTKVHKVISLLAIAFVGIGLVVLAYWDKPLESDMLLIIIPALGCALLYLLIPWPVYPGLPKLGYLPEARKIGPLGTAIFLAMALVLLASFALGPFLHVVSGDLFRSEFHRIHVGTVLDQPTIGKWFFLSALFAALAFPYAATARWMSDRSTRLGYWAFAVPTAALCLCLLSILTMPFWWLLQYIHAMGFTEMRIYGVVCGLLGYIVILGFLCWAVWPPNKKRKPDGTGKHACACAS